MRWYGRSKRGMSSRKHMSLCSINKHLLKQFITFYPNVGSSGFRSARYARHNNSSWENEVEWLLRKTQGYRIQANGVKLILLGCIYWVWSERIRRIFRGGANSTMVAQELVWWDVRMKLQAVKFEMKKGAERDEMIGCQGVEIQMMNKQRQWVKWKKPLRGSVELNSKGSLCNGLGDGRHLCAIIARYSNQHTADQGRIEQMLWSSTSCCRGSHLR